MGAIARKYHVSVNNLKSWNNLKGNNLQKGQRLTVFADAAKFEANVSQTSASNVQKTKSQPIEKANYHFVKKGESFGMIAKKYNCSVADLQSWNNLKSVALKIDQKLLVCAPVKEEKVEKTSAEANKNSSGNIKYIYHTVKVGDTLWDIAQQYQGATVNEIKKLNNLSGSTKLKPGQKLKVAIVG